MSKGIILPMRSKKPKRSKKSKRSTNKRNNSKGAWFFRNKKISPPPRPVPELMLGNLLLMFKDYSEYKNAYQTKVLDSGLYERLNNKVEELMSKYKYDMKKYKLDQETYERDSNEWERDYGQAQYEGETNLPDYPEYPVKPSDSNIKEARHKLELHKIISEKQFNLLLKWFISHNKKNKLKNMSLSKYNQRLKRGSRSSRGSRGSNMDIIDSKSGQKTPVNIKLEMLSNISGLSHERLIILLNKGY